MILKDKQSSEFISHPETDGMVKAVIVDITPLKEVDTQYGVKEVFQIVFESEIENDEGKRFCVWSRRFTPSLSDRANLRKELKKIMGRDFTALELKGFDIEALIGFGVNMIIQHEIGSNGNTYAVMRFIAPDKSGSPLKASGAYTRVKDREVKDYDNQVKSTAPAAKKAEPAAKAVGWQSVIVHVGKFKGKALGDVPEDGVMALLDHWLPTADVNSIDDAALAKALKELAMILDPSSQDLPF
jgi:hypothetical protein